MKRLRSTQLILLCLLVLSACSQLPPGLRSNAFEQRFPVVRCGGKVQVKDPDPAVVYGQYINPGTGIWLLTPYVALKPPKYTKTEEDFRYINTMKEFLVTRIQDKFEREEWVQDFVEYDVEDLGEEKRDEVVSQMVSKAVRLDTVNYGNWDVPSELILSDVQGYSLFMFIDGQLGYNDGNQNILYLFVIDNQTRKTTYADYMRYECDVRNLNGLDKILDYAYLKLLTLRFPGEVEKEKGD